MADLLAPPYRARSADPTPIPCGARPRRHRTRRSWTAGPVRLAAQSDLPLNCVPSFFDAPEALNVAAQHCPFSDWIWAVTGRVRKGSEKLSMLPPLALNCVFALPASPAFRSTLSAPFGVRSGSL